MARSALALTLFILTCTHAVLGQSTFKIYAPSRSTQSLWIVSASVDDGVARLHQARQVPLGVPGATIVAHPQLPLLYVSPLRTVEGGTTGVVVTLDPQGNYKEHSNVNFDHGNAFLSLDRRQNFLLGVDYFGGFVDVYPLGKDGLPGKAVTNLDEGRRNAHCIWPSPDNRFVYIPYVKDTTALYQYRFDGKTGALQALKPKNVGPPGDSGPRHLAYHPKKPFVYFSNEQHLGVSVYEIAASGSLIFRQVCDAVPDGTPKDGVSSSDILITPDGRFLYAGIRGHKRDFDWISRYAVQPDGQVKLLGLTPADKIPWGLALSPDGRHLLVTAFEGATLTAFAIQPDGQLRKTANLTWEKQISDLVTR